MSSNLQRYNTNQSDRNYNPVNNMNSLEHYVWHKFCLHDLLGIDHMRHKHLQQMSKSAKPQLKIFYTYYSPKIPIDVDDSSFFTSSIPISSNTSPTIISISSKNLMMSSSET